MLTNIPVSKQVWRGWPDNIADELSLAQIGIPKKHRLFVKPKDDGARNVKNVDFSPYFPFFNNIFYVQMPVVSMSTAEFMQHTANRDSDDDDDDAADMMDDDDSIFLPEKSSNHRRIQPLIPDDFGSDDAMAAIRFSEEFANRYGNPHPQFFPGSLDDAIRESCNQPAKNVRILY